MKLDLQPTGRIETVEGTPCRIWSGTTDAGVPVLAYVALIQPQTHDPAQLAAFEAELEEVQCERQLVFFDVRMTT